MDLTELYDLHERGDLGSDDPRWDDVQTLLRETAKAEVRRSARRLYGEPLESAIDQVEGLLLQKFISRRFSPRNGRCLEPLLRTTCRNDLISVFRKSRSPSAVGFDGAEASWENTRTPVVTSDRLDLFGTIRGSLPPFRFREHAHVRESLLAVFLTHHRLPGPSHLASLGVASSRRQTVYNAAVVDLNQAMMRICDA